MSLINNGFSNNKLYSQGGLEQNNLNSNGDLTNPEISRRKRQDLEDLAYEALDFVVDEVTTLPRDSDEPNKKYVSEKTNDIVNTLLVSTSRNLSSHDRRRVNTIIMDEVFEYGPITSLLNDSTVTEIMVNSTNNIYIERKGKIEETEISFRDERHIYRIIDKILSPLGRRVDESSPMVDARLPDGSRVNIIIPPLSIKGPSITIRKFAAEPLVLNDLISFGTLNSDIALFLKSSVRGRVNIIISGGTGSGKTTFLNVLSAFIPNDERIITIEDAAELQLKQGHVVTLESRPPNIEGKGQINIRDLVVNSLRMRPDRIIVGEVRSAEALDMLQAMNTGHDGSITTVHANSTRDSLSRLETMVMMSGMELPSRAIREQISSALNLVIQLARYPDGSRKIEKISEIIGMEGETILLSDIYRFNHEGFNDKGMVLGKHVPTGIVPTFVDEIKEQGENVPLHIFGASGFSQDDIKRRRK